MFFFKIHPLSLSLSISSLPLSLHPAICISRSWIFPWWLVCLANPLPHLSVHHLKIIEAWSYCVPSCLWSLISYSRVTDLYQFQWVWFIQREVHEKVHSARPTVMILRMSRFRPLDVPPICIAQIEFTWQIWMNNWPQLSKATWMMVGVVDTCIPICSLAKSPSVIKLFMVIPNK